LPTYWGTKLNSHCILILGGARSGKSQFAQELAQKLSDNVLFVATAEALDDEMHARIMEHRKNRPATWKTVEAPRQIGRALKGNIPGTRVVLIDCLTLLASNIMTGGSQPSREDCEESIRTEIRELIAAIDEAEATFIVVSNEVGMGLVPDNALGREYRDNLGKVNQMLASRSNVVYLMVAGIPVKIKG